MVVGATGAGKTTLINGMINYILGVSWHDNFRFKMVVDPDEAKQTIKTVSQTRWITAYTIHKTTGFSFPYSLTIVDTPGFGDTRGIEFDKQTMDNIANFFCDDIGINYINAIGFVVKSRDCRLTPSQHFIFDSVLSLFGKDVAENIFILITFADGGVPPVLNAINDAKIPCEKTFFKFNNSALFANKSNDVARHGGGLDLFDEMYWSMGQHSFEEFFKYLEIAPNKSLKLTKDVLLERRKLEVSVVGIHNQIREGLCKLNQLTEEIYVLDKHRSDIEANKNFTYEVWEEVTKCVDIPTGIILPTVYPAITHVIIPVL
ncbi:hypothetical protein HOLleu_36043 [Holothuria leucospilota]|uniref:Septin-type G domain-containing protein n=1 Tax=Holothuria leucospilota TaxID=206669 RepID=A0A9Q1BEE3_HOLLE|nr:hypothetical protein HOLleu_36043 [Holothuria leucospilota]